MKKLFIWLFIGLSLFPLSVHAEEVTDTTLATNSRSAILIENTTGKVLFEKNADERVAIASLTKMMSQIIILEQIEAGKLTWDEMVKVSANAAGYGGTQIYLQPGEEMSVEDLFKGVSMASANDVAVTKKQSLVISEEIII